MCSLAKGKFNLQRRKLIFLNISIYEEHTQVHYMQRVQEPQQVLKQSSDFQIAPKILCLHAGHEVVGGHYRKMGKVHLRGF